MPKPVKDLEVRRGAVYSAIESTRHPLTCHRKGYGQAFSIRAQDTLFVDWADNEENRIHGYRLDPAPKALGFCLIKKNDDLFGIFILKHSSKGKIAEKLRELFGPASMLVMPMRTR